MGVAQKTIDSSANSKRGDSGALIEYIGSGIGFITILPIFRHHFPGLEGLGMELNAMKMFLDLGFSL